jgi:hypothetical protein
MIIDKIIFAVDDNPKYSNLWKINSEICKKVLGITPVLFHITEEDSDFYEDEYGIVKKIKRLPNHSTGFQSQIYRMYGTKYFPDEVCITSDIDMLTINKSYITDQIKHFNENDFIVYTSDGYDKNRPECVDIYCDPRVSMCYNAGKGSTFNEIFNTERSFFDFANEVRETYWQEHDCDELFLGTKISNFINQNRIKRLRRGYRSPFICPKRIERPPNENLFNVYNETDIKNGNIVDIHLSRPYSKHKIEIDKLRRIILNEDDEVYLIGCHIENETQENLLRNLVNTLKDNNKDFILVSHTLIPQDIIEQSVGFIYDTINPKYKTWELNGFTSFRFESNSFTIDSPYIGYGSSDYYHVGVIRLLINGLRFIQKTNYKIVHWIEYDSIPNFKMNETASKDLKLFDFIFYGVGSMFSFKTDRVSKSFLDMSDDDIFRNLGNNDYLAEKLIKNELIFGKTKTHYLDENETNTWGKYSQNFNETKINWSLFETDGNLNLFLHNISNEDQMVEVFLNDKEMTYKLNPYTWHLFEVGNKKDSDYFEIRNNKVLCKTLLSNKENYNNIINKVIFTIK